MDYADIAVLAIISISILVGALRGFVKEAFSLVVWAAAFFVAYQFSGAVAMKLDGVVDLPSARTALAFAGLFLSVLLVGGLLTYLIGKLVEKTGLSGSDRLLGGVFGGVRGLVLILVLMLVAGLTPVPNDPWWKSSRSVQSLMPLAQWAAGYLPDTILEHLDLAPEAEEAASDDETPVIESTI
jgi:membrane protein required for colicin V production